ncbi:MAG: flavin reductase family protein [Fusobacteriaceae bacterium]|nr:flavin reductase family protein [Fusobacteriaceae bacterium]MBP6468639.1 flavin reductase family protein [Fusobacteriaceae bacterium]MBP9596054.1 flavin reductase family protein [Fusobacteriaceae bacterium]
MKKREFKGSVLLNPVPVVMITCRNKEGKENVFTVAWTGTICTKPPMLSISIRPERLSYEYIKETMEFTVNMPHRKQTRETDFCGVRSGRQLDKIKECGFTMVEGKDVNVPFIKECPVNIECKVKQIIPLGTHDIFLAEVVGSHVNENLMDENDKIHLEWANLISYSHGEYFPISNEPIGKFGYSVAKKKEVEKKVEEVKKIEKPKKRKYGNRKKKKAE